MLWSERLAKLTRVPYPLLGSVIIPLTLLAAFLETRHWSAIPIVLGFSVLGLLMKQYKWPRPPLILGFILGGLIEENLLSAISLQGIGGVLQRPLTIGLLIITLFMGFFSPPPAAPARGASPVPQSAGAAVNEAVVADAPPARPRWRWTWQNLFPLFFILVAGAFVWEASHFKPKAASFPIFLGCAVIILALLQILQNGWKRGRAAEVLDLGMLSEGIEGRARSAAILVGLILLFIVLSMLIGMEWGAIVIATVAPATLMTGKRPWAWGALTGSLIALFAFLVFDEMMDVIWPEPVLWTWLQSALFS
jgi:hypothetical protein